MPKKVLIADDSMMMRSIIKNFASKSGKELIFVEANNGKEAVEKYNAEKPDLVFMDIMMPEMNGWELSMKLKADKKTSVIPIVFLTCLDDPACKRMGLTFGTDYLQKPFNARQLYDAICKSCKKR